MKNRKKFYTPYGTANGSTCNFIFEVSISISEKKNNDKLSWGSYTISFFRNNQVSGEQEIFA